MFENFHNSLNSLEYQYSVHNSLLDLLSDFQDAITPQNIAKNNIIDNKRTFQRTLTHFIFTVNVRNNYDVKHWLHKTARCCVVVWSRVCDQLKTDTHTLEASVSSCRHKRPSNVDRLTASLTTMTIIRQLTLDC